MPAVAIVGIALTIGSMAMQAKAASDAKKLALKTGNQNQQIDEQGARQLEINTEANIRAERKENDVYISRQQAAYSASGVLSSGSPLDVEATTAGRLEQAVQQRWIDSQVQATNMRIQGAMGREYAGAQASAIQTQANIAMLKGGAQLASQAYGAYQSGAFSSAPKTETSFPASSTVRTDYIA